MTTTETEPGIADAAVTAASTGELAITRTFDAPRELVFAAWSDPEHLRHWYAPAGCALRFHGLDFRTGGTFHHTISTAGFPDCTCAGTYDEIVPPERIVYTSYFADEEGRYVEPAQVGREEEWPGRTTVTVTFTERDGKTTVTLHQTIQESLAMRTGAYQGWLSMLDNLAAWLAGSRKVG